MFVDNTPALRGAASFSRLGAGIRLLLLTLVGLDATASQAALSPAFAQGAERLAHRSAAEPAHHFVARVAYPRGGVVGSVAFGYENGVDGRPARTDSPFRIASVTKTFTAVAVMKLVERGRFDLDSPIGSLLSTRSAELLRQGGADPAAITVRHVLGHRSGLFDYAGTREYFEAVRANPRRRWTRREQLRFALDLARPIPPDLAYVYADTNYILLGEILERATGLPLAAALRTTLDYDGLGLRHTYLESLEPVPPGTLPRLHQFVEGIDTFDVDPSFDLWGGGGLVSTVGDLSRFFRGLFKGHLVAPATLGTMTRAVSGGGFGEEAYALGLMPFYLGNQECFGHVGFSGAMAGYCPGIDFTFALSVGNNRFPGVSFDRNGFGRQLAELLGIDLAARPFGPAFRLTRCSPEGRASALPLRCGMLAVPERRGVERSNTIELAVILGRHPEQAATVDPLLFLGGGPGEPLFPSAVGLLAASELALPLAAGQDLVFVEQRGVGSSSPVLNCDRAILNQADARACSEKFRAAGIDLFGYNSLESAADLEVLRRTLKVEQWNLIGFSYGTRLAMTMVRERPATIRSLVLDGAFPQESSDELDAPLLSAVIRRAIARCTAEPACARTFPRLEERYLETVEALNRAPITVNGVAVDGDDLVLLLALFQTRPELVEYLPAVLDGLARRDPRLLAAIYPPSDPGAGPPPDTAATAMFLSVTCNEEVPFFDRAVLAGIAASGDPIAAAFARSSLSLAAICDEWPSGRAPRREGLPVHTTVPTLVFNGDYDLQTPPQSGQALAARLPNARGLDFVAGGHIASQQFPACALSLVAQFERSGDPRRLDPSCVNEIQPPLWRNRLDEAFFELVGQGAPQEFRGWRSGGLGRFSSRR